MFLSYLSKNYCMAILEVSQDSALLKITLFSEKNCNGRC